MGSYEVLSKKVIQNQEQTGKNQLLSICIQKSLQSILVFMRDISIHHGSLKVRIISVRTQRSDWCNLTAHALVYVSAYQTNCLLITLKAISGSTKCLVSNKCFVMKLFEALS